MDDQKLYDKLYTWLITFRAKDPAGNSDIDSRYLGITLNKEMVQEVPGS
jgi:hypothetical protein